MRNNPVSEKFQSLFNEAVNKRNLIEEKDIKTFAKKFYGYAWLRMEKPESCYFPDNLVDHYFADMKKAVA